MKLCVKKVYCPTCQRLVKCHEEYDSGKLRVLCFKCGNPVWLKEGGAWKYARSGTQ